MSSLSTLRAQQTEPCPPPVVPSYLSVPRRRLLQQSTSSTSRNYHRVAVVVQSTYYDVVLSLAQYDRDAVSMNSRCSTLFGAQRVYAGSFQRFMTLTGKSMAHAQTQTYIHT